MRPEVHAAIAFDEDACDRVADLIHAVWSAHERAAEMRVLTREHSRRVLQAMRAALKAEYHLVRIGRELRKEAVR